MGVILWETSSHLSFILELWQVIAPSVGVGMATGDLVTYCFNCLVVVLCSFAL